MRLDDERCCAAEEIVRAGVADRLFPGAVLTVATAEDDRRFVTGHALRYTAVGVELPDDQWVGMTPDTVFDLASISKLFTTTVIMQLAEQGVVDLERPVSAHLEEFDTDTKRMITVADLLTHTSGLPWWLPLWSDHHDPAARLRAALVAEPDTLPGSAYCYSDINLITVGELVHRLTGRPLDELVATGVTRPLGMTETGYNPDPALWSRVAATEDEVDAGRGMVRGSVHDENAWSLGGVAGHAGVFSTATDLTRLARCLLAGGVLDDVRVLSADSLAAMAANRTAAFDHDHGLGFEVNQPSFMGGLAGPRTIGHTGFTGTSMVINLDTGLIAILLTNRVHPTRQGPSINPVRAAVGNALTAEA